MVYTLHKEARVAYSSTGKGRVLVLLHGFLGNSSLWDAVVPELATKFRVITIDLPGHGKSEYVRYVHTMDEMAGAVKAVLTELRIRKAILVGHSMGGYVALAFADLYPDFVKGLVLVHATADADSVERKMDRDRAIEAVKRKKQRLVVEFIPGLFAPENKEKCREISAQMTAEAKEMEPQSITASLIGMRDRPSRLILLKFAPYPVLYLAGKSDTVVTADTLSDEAALAAHGSIVLLENSGHYGMIEEPEEVIKALLNFKKVAR